MGLIALTVYSLYFFLFKTALAYNPTDIIMLDCGGTGSVSDNSNWVTDEGSKFMPQDSNKFSSVSIADKQPSTVEQIPYMTARIFESEFTYTFPLSTGPKFLRLYFYSANYSNLDKTKSFFDVTTSGRTILGNFSAFLFTGTNPGPSFVKEYVVYVGNNQKLPLTFTPSNSTRDSYAFVNGIEIVSMPDNLYLTGVGDNNTSTTLETMYRLNVGAQAIDRSKDTGMFRTWGNDDSYVNILGKSPSRDFSVLYDNKTAAYTAPTDVYTSQRSIGPDYDNFRFNLSWSFPVDSGFSYLVRLHFCEFVIDINGPNQRVFTVFLGGGIANKRVDVFGTAGGKFIPIFNDYVVSIPLKNGSFTTKLEVSLYPNMESLILSHDVILNGIEIFKLNNSDGSLAGPNPPQDTTSSTRISPVSVIHGTSRSSFPIKGVIGGGIVLIVIFSGLLVCMGTRKFKNSTISMAKTSWINLTNKNTNTDTDTTTITVLPSDLCRHFSLLEIKSATRNFDKGLVIGVGGFGYVYKGFIEKGGISVAIKRLNPESKQGAREFKTEIEILSKLRHLHLVSLIGYCREDNEMLLVYEYISRGTLKEYLYKAKNPPLTWKQRLQICIGSARGLHYLHTGAKQSIIHRDVKSTNILLDEKFVAKVSDFGLSKFGPVDKLQSHVSTNVKGSHGYLDPEYYRTNWLTTKSDVFSFGVVLLEVMCGRPALIVGLPKEQVNLVEWARNCYKKGTVEIIVDPILDGQMVPESFNKFFEVAFNCVRDKGIDRPEMNDVVWSLEFALQLQEMAERKNTTRVDIGLSSFNSAQEDGLLEESTSNVVYSVSRSILASTSTTEDHYKSDNVFSDIMNPRGR